MRLDKYLQVSKLVKRRTVANTLCNLGRVKVNTHPAKASKQVHIGDLVEIDFGSHRLVARITAIPATTKGSSTPLYEVVERVQGDFPW
ncbi:MAG: RNA-binding S4 domain-containing protein [Armatimonadota bacterium]|nr:RNA-binding S4 domain-containing protein [Armatimonadota bacterium]MDR5703509.1 RNA-binding S4 domain-containing protein [Armatimonadota bacterium]MDR7434447.1 RNA-binding S4 domain-containing protein [Armatimonadota bacterium]